jgi:decaprenyl-phosphate phosphoribosyltransferase
MNKYLSLLRVQQYYKNLLVFLVPFFGGALLNMDFIPNLILGFISLCMISSVNYIINDIMDVEKDKKNPEKKNRPIASGSVSVQLGLIIFVLSILIGYYIGLNFLFIILALFGLTQVYTFFFKEFVFMDVNFIAFNFLLRAISGTFITGIFASQWLLLISFFIAVYLALSKRRAEMFISNSEKQRKVLTKYSERTLDGLLILSLGIIFILFVLYTFQQYSTYYLATIPFVCYLMFRLYDLTYTEPVIARNIHRVLLKPEIVLVCLIVFTLFMLRIYSVNLI